MKIANMLAIVAYGSLISGISNTKILNTKVG